jgi:molecular chaperone IbpA|tara:strand:- start:392 stop:832 length:441 start_codon:yes stop_codon:yes gene_type:complete
MVATKAFSFPRSHFIGFDHVWSEIERLSEMADNKLYPPHNVVKKDETHFSIELALAGYNKEQLTVEVKDGILVVAGGKSDGEVEREYLHRGISAKKFTRTFRLSEHVVVDGADFIDGLLVIDLRVEVPEEKRPRAIPIGGQLLTEE